MVKVLICIGLVAWIIEASIMIISGVIRTYDSRKNTRYLERAQMEQKQNRNRGRICGFQAIKEYREA